VWEKGQTPYIDQHSQLLHNFLDRSASRPNSPARARLPTSYDQSQQQVFRADVIVAHAFGLLMRQTQNPPGALGKSLHTSQGTPPTDPVPRYSFLCKDAPFPFVTLKRSYLRHKLEL
jgi:hypothetical protein